MNGPEDNDDLLDRAAHAMAEAPAQGEFPEQEILRHVQSVLSSNGHSPRLASTPLRKRSRFFRRLSEYKSAMRVAATLLIGAVALGGLTWALFQSRPVLAFSIVADQLHNARTMSADLTVQESNVALTGKLMFSAPSRFRIEFPGMPHEVADLKAGRVVMIDHQSKSAVVMHLDQKDVTPADDPTAQSLDWIEKLRNISHAAGKPVGEEIIDGVRAKEFEVVEEGQKCTIWADAKTGAPLRVESTLQLGDKSLKLILDRVALDQPLEDAMFSTDVPKGYTEQETTISAATPAEKDLVAFFRDYAARTGTLPPSLVDFEKTLAPIVPKMSPGVQTLPQGDFMQMMVQAGRVMMLLGQMPGSADWHYAGAGVKPSASDAATKPVFWYHAGGAKSWRVIYGDLHSADVSMAEGPRGPAETQPVQNPAPNAPH